MRTSENERINKSRKCLTETFDRKVENHKEINIYSIHKKQTLRVIVKEALSFNIR